MCRLACFEEYLNAVMTVFYCGNICLLVLSWQCVLVMTVFNGHGSVEWS